MRPTSVPVSGTRWAASRRAVLGVPLVLFLGGCSTATLDRLQAPRSTPPAPPNPDQPSVDVAIGAISALVGALRPWASRTPALAELVALHEAHLRRLGSASGSYVAPPVRLDGSRRQVRQRETALVALLAERAGAVHDGALARLLASMSAAVAQRVVGLGAAT